MKNRRTLLIAALFIPALASATTYTCEDDAADIDGAKFSFQVTIPADASQQGNSSVSVLMNNELKTIVAGGAEVSSMDGQIHLSWKDKKKTKDRGRGKGYATIALDPNTNKAYELVELQFYYQTKGQYFNLVRGEHKLGTPKFWHIPQIPYTTRNRWATCKEEAQ
jgi:hypothetical protein